MWFEDVVVCMNQLPADGPDSNKKLLVGNCLVNKALSKTIHKNKLNLSLFYLFWWLLEYLRVKDLLHTKADDRLQVHGRSAHTLHL